MDEEATSLLHPFIDSSEIFHLIRPNRFWAICPPSPQGEGYKENLFMYTATVITISDRAAQGIYEDKSGPAIAELLTEQGYQVLDRIIIPDKKNTIVNTLQEQCDKGVHLIVTTGGTGFAPRDITPEATKEVIEREVPGIAEYMRQKSMEITPRGMLSRGIAGIKGNSLIVNLPGSPKGATENLGFVLPSLTHGLDMLNGIKE